MNEKATSAKEIINRDNRLLSYKIIPSADPIQVIEKEIPEADNIEQFPYQDPYQELSQEQSQPEPESIPEREPENIIEPVTEPEPETPPRKRRIHWIVPVAVGVIIVLSLVFYFRTSQQSAVDGQRSAVDGQRSAVDGQRSAVDGQRSAVGGQQSAVISQQPADSVKREPEPTQKSEIINTKSELNTPARTTEVVQSFGQHSTLNTVPEGTRLFRLAREIYGNPYLWVLIYKENLDKIPDPDMVVSGNELIIPVLEGKPDRLSRNDSSAVSEGYRLVYEYYLPKDEAKARDFALAMKRYKPKG